MSYKDLTYRADIDGLRALAVFAVIAYHASPLQMQGGFIGVDIFFVISGFLISTLVLQNLACSQFSFLGFYSRRIKRIFPALLLVLTACIVCGWLALYSDEYQQLGWHILSGGGFLSNFVLWSESGYFDSVAEAKPLLHLWSLGIEEQFYLLCPLLLWLLAKWRLRPFMPLLFLFLLSFLLNLITVHYDPVSAFYLPHTRFWELLAGVLLAHQILHAKVKINKAQHLYSFFGLLLIVLGLVLISNKRLFPGAWALLPTLGTVLIIGAGPNAWLNKHVFASKIAVWFGLISFPLYLWHWPIFSFIHIIKNGEDMGRTGRIFAVFVAIILAWLTYHYLEKPIRSGSKQISKLLLLASILVLFLGLSIYQMEGYPSRTYLAAKQKAWTDKQQMVSAYEDSKVFTQTTLIPKRDFFLANTLPEQAEIAILGDSHANRLYWALHPYKEMKLLNLGRGTCPPLLDVEVEQRNGMSLHCQPFTNNYLRWVKDNPHIRLILLNAYFYQYQKKLILKTHNRQINLEDALAKTLDYFKDSPKKIVVATDVPIVPRSCYKRSFPVWNVKRKPICTITKAEFARQNQPVFRALSHYPEVVVFNPKTVFCLEQCGEVDPHKTLYLRDGNHLNDFGLAQLGPTLHEFVSKQ